MRPQLMLVTTDFPPDLGGIQAVLHNTARAITHFDLTVVAPAHPDAAAFDRDQPFEICRVKPLYARTRAGRIGRNLAMTVTTMSRLKRRGPAAVLCGHPFTAGVGLLAKRTFGVPYVVWTHAKELLAWQPLLRLTLPPADSVLVISRHTSGLAARLGVPAEKMVRIPYAPDSPVSVSSSPHAGSGRKILTVARLDELYKGHDVMMRALPLVAGRFPDVEWIIVGDGKLRAHYEQLASARGLANRVTFTGAVTREQRDEWFRQCDVFVMLSRDSQLDGGAEGFGIVFLEANAFGKPVVAGRAGGSTDAVVDEQTGMLVDPENELEVADAICGLLGDPQRARSLGDGGRDRVAGELSWARTAAAIEEVLLKAIRSRE